MSDVFIGTSGFQYKHWKGSFYPENNPLKDWLGYYSDHFNTVEINSSFYGKIRPKTYSKWLNTVPENFIFSIKANRYITHLKRLKDVGSSVKIFFDSMSPIIVTDKTHFARKHVVLWQLHPAMIANKINVDRFESLIKNLDQRIRHVVEFRHPSWCSKKIINSLLREAEKDVSIVFQDWKDWPMTSDFFELYDGEDNLISELPFIYFRFHGKDSLYSSSYSDEELAKWADKMRKWLRAGKDIYAYFNNDASGFAPKNALTLRVMFE